MNRSTWLALTMVAWLGGLMPADVAGQERSLDLSVGRIVLDRLPSAIATPVLAGRPSQLVVSFRDTRRPTAWLQASGAVPFDADALAWGSAGAGGRLLWPRERRGLRAGADAAGQGYMFRGSGDRRTGVGAIAEAHGVVVAGAGNTTLEIRAGSRAQLVSFAGAASRRSVAEGSARITIRRPVRFDADVRAVRTPEGVAPYAGATLFAYGRTPIYAWAQAGKWFGDAPFDKVAWTAGTGYSAGQTRIWVSVRQDASDPLYRNSPRRSWSVGVTRRLGPGLPPIAERQSPAGITVRLNAIDAPTAGPVSIGGTFSGWQPTSMIRQRDQWVAHLALEPGIYHYAFKAADGTWFVPPGTAGRRSDGMGGFSVLLVVP